jgi:hypothetical protein
MKAQPAIKRDSVAYEIEKQEAQANNWRAKYA